jgi:hypothetical protein
MAANATTNTQQTSTNTTQRNSGSATQRRSDPARIREGLTKVRNGSVSYARHTAERSVDVPVGAVLSAADRVTGLVEPFTTPDAAGRELRTIRTRAQRELNRLERRGATTRRKARTRVRRTRNRLERELTRRRRRVETTVRQNRVKAERRLRRAQSSVSQRVSAIV